MKKFLSRITQTVLAVTFPFLVFTLIDFLTEMTGGKIGDYVQTHYGISNRTLVFITLGLLVISLVYQIYDKYTAKDVETLPTNANNQNGNNNINNQDVKDSTINNNPTVNDKVEQTGGINTSVKDVKDSTVNITSTTNIYNNIVPIQNAVSSKNETIKFVGFPSLDVVYGRVEELCILKNFFVTKNKRHCAVTAASCFGKTFLIKKFLRDVYEFEQDYKNLFDGVIYLNCKELASADAAISNFVEFTGVMPNRDNFFNLIKGRKILCVFDNFESWVENKRLKADYVSFVHKLFTQDNRLSTVFVSQIMPSDDENFNVTELTDISKKLYQGLDKDSALAFAKIEGEKVNLDKVADEKLNDFFAKINYIPQGIRSLISYLKLKNLSFDKVSDTFDDDFRKFETSKERFTDVNDLIRPTLYLLELQINAQDNKSKELLSVLAFFQTEIPEYVVNKFKPQVSVIETDAVKVLSDNWLIDKTSVVRGDNEFNFYSVHSMICGVVRDVLPKFENNNHKDFEVFAKEFFDVALSNHDRQHNYEEAMNLYRCVEKLCEYLIYNKGRTELFSDLAATYLNKGVSLRSLSKLKEAVVEYDKAIGILKDLVENGRTELSNDLAGTYLNKGVSLRNLGKLREAIVEYDKAIEMLKGLVKNGHTGFINNLAKNYLNKGVLLDKLGKLDEAIAEYEKVIEIWENLIRTGRTELSSDLASAYLNKGLSLFHLNKLDEAIITNDKAMQIWENLVNKGCLELTNNLAITYLNKGVSLNSLNKTNEAIDANDKAIKIFKDLVDNGRFELVDELAMAYTNKGVSLWNLGKLNEAVIEYDKAIKIRERLVEQGRVELANALAMTYTNKGVSLWNLDKINEAIIEYDKAIEIRDRLVNKEGMYWLQKDLDMSLNNKRLITDKGK
jgi:tetratricopeptide (TPR) repeat protein